MDKDDRTTNINLKEYEVVRKEFFSHIYEPAITFRNFKINVNSGCLKCLPETNSIQILVNSNNKKLVLKPCNPNAKDSLTWCTPNRNPRRISCKLFSEKIFYLMNWKIENKYRVLGDLVIANNEKVIIFDLNSAEVFIPNTSLCSGILPHDWENSFGINTEEHNKILESNLLNKNITIKTNFKGIDNDAKQ